MEQNLNISESWTVMADSDKTSACLLKLEGNCSLSAFAIWSIQISAVNNKYEWHNK